MEKISVIIPVYKGEKFIPDCIAMLKAQTADNLELIFVDDGSPDHAGELLEQECAKLNNAKVLHKENGGVSSARNLGLEHATGDYVVFADADDRWTADYLQTLYDHIDENTQLVISGYRLINPQGEELLASSLDSGVIAKEDVIRRSMVRHDIFSALWNKIFSMKIIREHGIGFDESLTLGEDWLFLCQYCRYIDLAFITSERLYDYVINPKGAILSSMSSKKFEEKWMDDWKAAVQVEALMQQMGIESGALMKVKKARIADKLLSQMEQFHYEAPALRREWLQTLRRGLFPALSDAHLEGSKKLSMAVNAVSPKLCWQMKKIRSGR